MELEDVQHMGLGLHNIIMLYNDDNEDFDNEDFDNEEPTLNGMPINSPNFNEMDYFNVNEMLAPEEAT
jgi:hypothetical protein